MENDCEHISRFIMRRLQCKLTEEEARILGEWMRAGKEHREMLDGLSDLSELKKDIRLYGSFDELKGWEKVRKVCWQHALGERFGYLKIAIIVLLCLGGCLFFLTQPFRIRENKQVLSLAEVRPGMNQALLILGNGKEVYLQGSGSERDSLYGEGWKVKGEGKLCYEQEPSLADTEERWHILRVPKGGEYSLLLGDGLSVLKFQGIRSLSRRVKKGQ